MLENTHESKHLNFLEPTSRSAVLARRVFSVFAPSRSDAASTPPPLPAWAVPPRRSRSRRISSCGGERRAGAALPSETLALAAERPRAKFNETRVPVEEVSEYLPYPPSW